MRVVARGRGAKLVAEDLGTVLNGAVNKGACKTFESGLALLGNVQGAVKIPHLEDVVLAGPVNAKAECHSDSRGCGQPEQPPSPAMAPGDGQHHEGCKN